MKVATVCGAALVLSWASGHAADIRVVAGACDEPVRLVARDAPLSSVLKRLGESLGFAVVYQSKNDPLITRDERSSSLGLIRDLASGVNFSVEQTSDARCVSGVRVAKVSVLPDQGDKASTPVVKQNSYTPEMERIARQTKLDYLRSHGMEQQAIESLGVK